MGVGQTQATEMGTLLWMIEDDDGTICEELIPNSYLVPQLPVQLLSPQHWSQVNKDHNAHGDTNAEWITLDCDDYVKTISLNKANIGIFRSASGFCKV